jgi:hypothetical protein
MLEAARGDKPVAAYLKELVLKDAQRAQHEVYEYEQVLADIAQTLKELLKRQSEGSPQNNGTIQKSLNEIKDITLIIGGTMPAALTTLRNAGYKK